jgi:hypothetical protein
MAHAPCCEHRLSRVGGELGGRAARAGLIAFAVNLYVVVCIALLYIAYCAYLILLCTCISFFVCLFI